MLLDDDHMVNILLVTVRINRRFFSWKVVMHVVGGWAHKQLRKQGAELPLQYKYL